ncbi:MAG TPA: hypothetical protein VK574_07445 [Terracidiphilus sp.]|nr:hypothetical protein [Terracidiphilus sp.]
MAEAVGVRVSGIVAVLLLGWAATGLSADSSEVTADEARVLESARALALAYTQNLPNFICTQVTHREAQDQITFGTTFNGASSSRGGAGPAGAPHDSGGMQNVIEERLTFFDQMEHYEVVAVNGKKADGQQHMQFGGAISAGEFGSALNNLFDPRAHAEFSWERAASLNGRSVDVFKFHVPSQNGTIVLDRDTGQKILVASSGRLLVDSKTFEVERISSSLELPVGFPIKMATIEITYRPVEIAGKTYNLPSRSEVRMKDSVRLYVNEIQFREYHKFGVESTIHYDGPPSTPNP